MPVCFCVALGLMLVRDPESVKDSIIGKPLQRRYPKWLAEVCKVATPSPLVLHPAHACPCSRERVRLWTARALREKVPIDFRRAVDSSATLEVALVL